MRVNMDKLRGLMKEHHVTIADLCEALGMNPSTFYRKANRPTERASPSIIGWCL